jgi:hypothetical protein
MIDYRVLFGAVALFLGAFAAVSFVPKGAPVATSVRPALVASTAPQSVAGSATVEASPSDPEPDSAAASAASPERTPLPPSRLERAAASERELSQGRDRIRISAIQAATAYALAPCDTINKAALLVAMSTYLRSIESEPDRDDVSADERVRHALRSAMSAGGLTGEDFPVDGLPLPASLVRIGDSRLPACDGPRRAERRR